jgi:hypothetical protein
MKAWRPGTIALLVAAVMVAAACDDDETTDADAGGSGGQGASDGAGGAGGSGGDGCGCPSTPPLAGDPCAGCAGTSCTYLDCDAAGHGSAACGSDGTWAVTTEACEPVSCGEDACAIGQICLTIGGGALLQNCTDNPCDDGLLSCDCAVSLCPASAECSVSGSEVYCNTCPSNDCP